MNLHYSMFSTVYAALLLLLPALLKGTMQMEPERRILTDRIIKCHLSPSSKQHHTC